MTRKELNFLEGCLKDIKNNTEFDVKGIVVCMDI